MFARIVVTHKPGAQLFKRESDLRVVLLSGVSTTRLWLDNTTTFTNYRSTPPQSGLNNHNPDRLIYVFKDQPISQKSQGPSNGYRWVL